MVRFKVDGEDTVLVEVDDGEGSIPVGGGDRIGEAAEALTEKLSSVSKAISVTLEELGRTLKPETVKVTVGVKLKAETGAVIAKSAVEGNFQVEMEWRPGADRDRAVRDDGDDDNDDGQNGQEATDT
ncbi:CU044_2847 family protein [Nocardiopsis sp. LOL_012]|uniref:CU044_2847 family protein n=1 Tax=Nocardiopsis sp. LOL_012 TaxID=3345409 RepID=UPI003A865AAB